MEPLLSRLVLKASASPRGFTLVEMLVVLAIIVIITTIAVLGQSSFNRSLILTDTAYTVAFSIREAQALGLSSRSINSVEDAGYGVHFASNSQGTYRTFADTSPTASGNVQNTTTCPGHAVGSGPEARPGDCAYNLSPNTNDRLVQTYTFNRGFTVSRFCGTDLGGVERCSGSYLTELTIIYLRPNTQSLITGMRGNTRVPLRDATIHIVSPDGEASRCVMVSKVGQISIANCP